MEDPGLEAEPAVLPLIPFLALSSLSEFVNIMKSTPRLVPSWLWRAQMQPQDAVALLFSLPFFGIFYFYKKKGFLRFVSLLRPASLVGFDVFPQPLIKSMRHCI